MDKSHATDSSDVSHLARFIVTGFNVLQKQQIWNGLQKTDCSLLQNTVHSYQEWPEENIDHIFLLVHIHHVNSFLFCQSWPDYAILFFQLQN